MRATTGVHKALMRVGGQTLIERNIRTLLAEGFHDIVVSLGPNHQDIESFLATRGAELASDAASTITCIRETVPLGTIGAAKYATQDANAVLVVNVDNLTTLPLRQLTEHHRRSGAAITIASHRESFRIPFGQLIVQDGVICEYREKPLLPILISSGTYVISAEVAQFIPRNRRCDITDLLERVRERGLIVRAFEHDCAWIDVNDETSLSRAEEMFGAVDAAK